MPLCSGHCAAWSSFKHEGLVLQFLGEKMSGSPQLPMLYRFSVENLARLDFWAIFSHNNWSTGQKVQLLHPNVRERTPWEVERESVSYSIMSNSWQPHGLYSTWLMCPWGSLSKNIGAGCQFLLQGIFLTQGSNRGLPHCRQIHYPSEAPGSHLPWLTGVLFTLYHSLASPPAWVYSSLHMLISGVLHSTLSPLSLIYITKTVFWRTHAAVQNYDPNQMLNIRWSLSFFHWFFLLLLEYRWLATLLD